MTNRDQLTEHIRKLLNHILHSKIDQDGALRGLLEVTAVERLW